MSWVVQEVCGWTSCWSPKFPSTPSSPSQRALLNNSGIAREKQVPPAATHAAKQSVTRYFPSLPPMAERWMLCFAMSPWGRGHLSELPHLQANFHLPPMACQTLLPGWWISKKFLSPKSVCPVWHSPFPHRGCWVGSLNPLYPQQISLLQGLIHPHSGAWVGQSCQESWCNVQALLFCNGCPVTYKSKRNDSCCHEADTLEKPMFCCLIWCNQYIKLIKMHQAVPFYICIVLHM